MALKSKIFQYIHTGNLVYNTCWEDPRSDRALLQFQPDSKVVMLTSAGCNALDYLLDQPASIDCVDMNPRQNALLQLKCALFNHTDHDTLSAFFGEGSHNAAQEVFASTLQHNLDTFPAQYWKQHIGAFRGKGLRKSFYYFGSSGMVAFFLKQWLAIDPKVSRAVHKMFEADDLYQQRALYYKVEPMLVNRVASLALDSHLVQSMLGVPHSQQEMARKAYTDGMTGYFRACLRKVFTELPLHDNYFWRVYFFGKYTPDCRPNYLKKEHFQQIKNQTSKVNTHTNTLSGFLKNNPGRYSHFILLDHQDWLAANDRAGLDEEWQLILQNSAPGARILFRSAAPDRNFLPTFVTDYGSFQENELTRNSHFQDRVGTYASSHLFVKK
jgi:S-adenosylmethionine-diacylglycerol 3-amino-3-carboxypropyl transferase